MKKLLLLLGLLAFVGCATVTRGVEEVFVVESNPVGAKVTLVYDEPVVLYVEDEKLGTEGGDAGFDESEKKTVMLEILEGVTPATFKIPRRGSFSVRIEKDGYQPVVTHVYTQISTSGGAALAGNICLGGCLGAAVDAGSGATLEHVPCKVSVKLERTEPEEEKPSPFRTPPSSRRGVELD